MSKVETLALAPPSVEYAEWLARERRNRLTIRGTQLALLLIFLVLWEVLPRAQIVNPLFTSYPSALWPTFLELLKNTPQNAGILTHAWATVLATIIGFTAAMLIGIAIAAALWWWRNLYDVLDPYLVVANAMPKTAFVPIFYIWLGATLSIYGMSLAISLFVTILMIYNGFQGTDPNKIKLAQTFGATKSQILAKVVLPGSVPTLIAATQGERRPLACRRRGRRISIRQSRPRLPDPVRQPDLQAQHRDDGDNDPRDSVIRDVSRDFAAGSRRDAAAVTPAAADS